LTTHTDPVVPRREGTGAAHERHGKEDEIGFALPEPPKVSGARALAVVVGVAVVGAGVFASAYLPRVRERAALTEGARAARSALPRVDVITPKASSSAHPITLPASMKPLEETILYSRANGFVKEWKVDIGDKVKAGQVLAQLETPELDQEIMQGRAQLAQSEASVKQAIANRDFAKSSLERYKKLSAEGLASQQELDEKSAQASIDAANVEVAEANVNTQRANLARLANLKSFATVTAPFAGTITARMIERGALVVPGNTAPLFKLAATDPMRVFVEVPQDVAPGVSAGVTVGVRVREFPGRSFSGVVARTAGALDPASRTLTTEVRVPNPDGVLLSGMFADATLTLPMPHRTFELPITAILTGAKGVSVQVVAADDAVHLVPVTIEQDLGATVRVSTGLDGSERVIKLASPGLADGSHVEVAR
jgi:membrane fusion protein (multidrug efflux system)